MIIISFLLNRIEFKNRAIETRFFYTSITGTERHWVVKSIILLYSYSIVKNL